MNSYCRIFIIIVLFLNYNIIKSQPLSVSENSKAHRRYWFYRTRITNDFMKIGGSQGDCIVLAERNQGKYDHTAKVGPDQIDITNQYLSALALEYKLLTRNNQNTDETIKEIFYLIKTINRLDARADLFWTSPTLPTEDLSAYSETANLNGFMLREDMHTNYLPKNLAHYNYELLENGYDGINAASVPNPLDTYKSFTGLEHASTLDNDNRFSNWQYFGTYGDPFHTKPTTGLSLVHDKYYSMFIAFMFIIKYLPDDTKYSENGVVQQFQDGESDIRKEVRNITNRCDPYLRGNSFGGTASNWIMEYPNGTSLTGLGQPNLYSYALAKMICYIKGGYPFDPPCNTDQDGVSASLGYISYNALWLNPVPYSLPALASEDGAVFTANAMAGSNAPVQNYGIPIPAWIAMDMNSTIHQVEWSNLLRSVMHQTGGMMKGKSVYATPINEAPCSGPYNFNIGTAVASEYSGFEWSSQDRLEHPSSRGNPNPFPGNYPGVDYMLLHNLYYEYLNQLDDKPYGSETGAYKYAYNFMDNEDNSDWPKKIGLGSGAITLGVNATDPFHINGNVKVFQYLKSTAHIYPTSSPAAPGNTTPSSVTYRAGKEISLQPGFQVLSGSTFYGYIKRYVCGVDDYEAGMRTANDSTKSNDYENDDMNDYAMHYVEYPKSDADNYPYGIEENDLEKNSSSVDNDLIIIPNPSTGIFNVQAKKISEDETLNIHVYDMKGDLILQFTDVSISTEINLQGFSKGIYMIHLNSSTGNSKIKKVSVVE